MNLLSIYGFKGNLFQKNILIRLNDNIQDECISNWNDGEIPWEEIKPNKDIVNATFEFPFPQKDIVSLPIEKIKPTIYTAYTGFIKEIYKEYFILDTFVEKIHHFNMNTFIIHKFDYNIDLYCMFLTYGLFYKVGGVNKVRDFYHTSYISRKTRKRIQRTATTITFILIMVLTKNVQSVI
jgi:hypothetical protein